MLTVQGSNEIKKICEKRHTVVCLGNFDGVHIAHRFLLCEAVRIADENNLLSVVYTFDKHPVTVMGKELAYITDNDEKSELIAQTGADVLYFQKTDTEFLKLSPYRFAKEIIRDTLNARAVVVGEHYTFGEKGAGDSRLLVKLGEELGFKAHIIPLMKKNNILVSSTAVREYLSAGSIDSANELLGRKYSVCGIVENGNKIGRTIGFPTINIYPGESRILPKYGVYSAITELDGCRYVSVVNVGVKPTVGSDRAVIEAHLLDASGDFYGKKVKICFEAFLRPEKKFDSLEKLKAQIEKDKNSVKK